MTASNFCKDCTHATKDFMGLRECELTRVHYVDGVTGKPWSSIKGCSYARTGVDTCSRFQQKPSLLARLKEVFQ